MPQEYLEIVLNAIQQSEARTIEQISSLREEIRSDREQNHEWQQKYGERIAEVEKSVKSGIDGNGQPSRLSNVETEVSKLKQQESRKAGKTAAYGILGGLTVNLVGWVVLLAVPVLQRWLEKALPVH